MPTTTVTATTSLTKELCEKNYLCTEPGNSQQFLEQHLQTSLLQFDLQVHPRFLHQRSTSLLLWLAALHPKTRNKKKLIKGIKTREETRISREYSNFSTRMPEENNKRGKVCIIWRKAGLLQLEFSDILSYVQLHVLTTKRIYDSQTVILIFNSFYKKRERERAPTKKEMQNN